MAPYTVAFNVNYETQWDAVFTFPFVFYFYTHAHMYVYTEGPKNVWLFSKLYSV
jgi:hypothetical protein